MHKIFILLKGKTQTFHPLVWVLLFGTFISRAGFFMSIPFLGIYLHEIKGYDNSITGAILGISFFISTFSSFLGGAWSDRFGRFPVIIVSMLLWSMMFIGFVFASEIWQFFLLNALSGFCRSLFEPTARALLVDVTPTDKRIDVFNTRYFAINIGGAIGPLVGLSLGSSKNPQMFFITAIIFFICGLLLIISKTKFTFSENNISHSEKFTLKSSMRIIASDKVFKFFLIGNIFTTGAYAQLDTTLSQYLGTENVGVYSFLFAANAIAILILQFPIVKIMKKYQPLTALKLGSFLFALGISGFGFSNSMILLVLSVVFFTVGEILCFIIGDVLISDIAPKHLRGAYFGASGLQFFGQSAGAWLGGMLLSILGINNGILIFGILSILTLSAYPFFQHGETLLKKEVDIRQNTKIS
ncbi:MULTISPECIES: MDR family MFS transporter [Heyndrickxia]|uniref:MFS transporter n=1 Tax=Heyndrickxia shackletonii TaxID=157838 RepID=A0A0Q3WZT1_9BACI|nr:MFS transporter [Heyndrickxia shackletonii]KQL54932.1 MFS transporter [Heyndrickxia shackletonii]MBB2482536.1 MFS transporter [Bacillus sp. APMAM]NEY99396.1 MFS transporter [Heyndrickxia shackletonii]RTZ54031.1 MFS transporter [Bacillus sp. SAJ1]